MQHYYDGQIRRYLLQTIRLLSNFVVKYGDGSLSRVPVMYGDSDRQVAHILKQNSENKINSAPRIAVYISGLNLDKDRLADATHVGKVHIRERSVENDAYTSSQGQNYTVERIMPTPYKLTVKADIWTTSTDQKLQLLEQILMLFNPSLEIQTTDNYLDWTSLSVVNLSDVSFSSRSIPVGAESNIDIATLTFDMPIWISPPTKVKKLGVITNIVMGIFDGKGTGGNGYIEGLGVDYVGEQPNISDLMATSRTTIDNFRIIVHGGQARILDRGENVGDEPKQITNTTIDSENKTNWNSVFELYPGQYRSGVSRIFLIQPDGTEVVGTVAINPIDETILTVNWDEDTYPNNTDITTVTRPLSPGTFDAIVDPEKIYPGSGLPLPQIGIRYLIINNIGGGIRETLIADSTSDRIDTVIPYSKVKDSRVYVDGVEVGYTSLRIPDNDTGIFVIRLNIPATIDQYITYELILNEDGPESWRNSDDSEFIANSNDVIEWDGSNWNVIFNAGASKDSIVYLTNTFTNVQYKWNGVFWSKSFEGEYPRGTWRLEL